MLTTLKRCAVTFQQGDSQKQAHVNRTAVTNEFSRTGEQGRENRAASVARQTGHSGNTCSGVGRGVKRMSRHQGDELGCKTLSGDKLDV